MEPVANLDKEFARVQVVGAAESEAIVEQDATIGNVQRFSVERKLLTEALSKREVKCGVRLEVIAGNRWV